MMPDDGPNSPVTHAASIVLLRDGAHGLEVLMLQRPAGGNFGGYWVFPGGKVDDADRAPTDDDTMAAFRRAAAREALEECALVVEAAHVQTVSYWEPPARSGVRFGTWFFAAGAPDMAIEIDGAEIVAFDWVRPADGHDRRNRGGFDLAPPTWVTLHTLGQFDTVVDALQYFAETDDLPDYRTRMARHGTDLVAMWTGDAGYEAIDPALTGPRHRLVLSETYRFERDAL
jgi:8-oxo-dGTP pyrophosphatase MutT (NUDIX family)